MSLFASRTRSHRGPGPRHIAARRAQGRATLNAFAEALAEHGTVSAAAREVGICQQRGSQLLKKIRIELGWQAQ